MIPQYFLNTTLQTKERRQSVLVVISLTKSCSAICYLKVQNMFVFSKLLFYLSIIHCQYWLLLLSLNLFVVLFLCFRYLASFVTSIVSSRRKWAQTTLIYRGKCQWCSLIIQASFLRSSVSVISLWMTLAHEGMHKDYQGKRIFRPFSGPALAPVQKKSASSVLLIRQRRYNPKEFILKRSSLESWLPTKKA